VAYWLKARIVESQQLAITSQWPINNNRGTVFCAESVPMAVHATMEGIMLSLCNKSLQKGTGAFCVVHIEILYKQDQLTVCQSVR
jgi:hypothetical protein